MSNATALRFDRAEAAAWIRATRERIRAAERIGAVKLADVCRLTLQRQREYAASLPRR